MINIDECFTVNRDKFISSALGDEIMLMNLETGNYIGLNIVSADIYKLAEEKTSAQQIINSLLKIYDVEEEVCIAQVLTCIENMMEKNLLVKI
jgi:hypothetical protein